MKRRTILSMIAALFTVAVAMFGGATAQAQCPNDCTFLVNASCSIPPNCFPFKLTTSWNQGMLAVIQTDIIANCGGTFYRQPMPCPPIWNILWASLDGGMTIAVPNGPPVQYILPCGVRVCLTVTIAPGGCVNVNIFPC